MVTVIAWITGVLYVGAGLVVGSLYVGYRWPRRPRSSRRQPLPVAKVMRRG